MSSFTLHRNPPFRVEHIGSLKRPDKLIAKREGAEDGKVSEKELTTTEDECIEWVVKKQQELGIRAVTDGEYRRGMFFSHFFESLDGFETIDEPSSDWFRPYMPDIAAFMLDENAKPEATVLCKAKIKHSGRSPYVPQFEYITKFVPKERWGEIKITLAAPNWYHFRYKEGVAYPKDVYSNDEEYLGDIAKAYQVELDLLYKAGCRNVQYDDPNLAYFCDQSMIDGWLADPLNKDIGHPDLTLARYISMYNDCISKIPSDMHVGVHLCRGNYLGSRHFSTGSYDRIATQLFQTLNVHTYYLEFDTPRAGGFESLVHLPKNKNLIMGVVTSKFAELENVDEMVKRVELAADYVAKGSGQSRQEALQRLGVSPQCGFASHFVGNTVTVEDMEKKLALVRTIADKIWDGEPRALKLRAPSDVKDPSR